MNRLEELDQRARRRTAFDPAMLPFPTADEIAKYAPDMALPLDRKKYKQTVELPGWMGGMMEAILDSGLTGLKNNKEYIERAVRTQLEQDAGLIERREVTAYFRRQQRLLYTIAALKARAGIVAAARQLRHLIYLTLEQEGEAAAAKKARAETALLVSDVPQQLKKPFYDTLFEWEIHENHLTHPETGEEVTETTRVPDMSDPVTALLYEALDSEEHVPDHDLEAGRRRIPGMPE